MQMKRKTKAGLYPVFFQERASDQMSNISLSTVRYAKLIFNTIYKYSKIIQVKIF